MCRSPRRELRRLGAKALAALTWNGHTDSRLLGGDVREHWRLWVEVAVYRAEFRLGLKHKCGQVSTDRVTLINVLAINKIFTAKPRHCSSKTLTCFASTPRAVAVARRQWTLRHRRTCEGPNHANMCQLVATNATWLFSTPEANRGDIALYSYESPAPLIKTLLIFSRDRDHDCVLAAVSGLAGVSFNKENAAALGRVDGLIASIVSLVCHANPEVVTLACDVSLQCVFM